MADWEDQGMVPKSIWKRFGDVGILGAGIPDEYGGSGEDFRFLAVATEEHARVGMAAPAFELHTGIVAPYLVRHGTEEQKQAWLPRLASGDAVASIGMTEPSSGSDLAGVRTTAVRDGDHYVINGSKIFITNGIVGDLIVLVTKTDTARKAKGVSLFLVDTSLPGYRKSRNLKKLGNKAQDTAELFFDNVRVPASSMLGEENGGWKVLMSELVQERILVAVRAASTCEAALDATIRYVKDRKAFGQAVFDFQNTVFSLPTAPPKPRRCASLPTDALNCMCAANSTCIPPQWPSYIQRKCRMRCSIPACSCTVAMAICGSTPSPGCGPTHGFIASMPGPMKSCGKSSDERSRRSRPATHHRRRQTS